MLDRRILRDITYWALEGATGNGSISTEPKCFKRGVRSCLVLRTVRERNYEELF